MTWQSSAFAVALAALALAIGWASSEGGLCGKAAFSQLEISKSLNCFEFWLNRYQTFVGSMAALGSAIAAIIFVQRQIKVAERQLTLANKIEVRKTVAQIYDYLSATEGKLDDARHLYSRFTVEARNSAMWRRWIQAAEREGIEPSWEGEKKKTDDQIAEIYRQFSDTVSMAFQRAPTINLIDVPYAIRRRVDDYMKEAWLEVIRMEKDIKGFIDSPRYLHATEQFPSHPLLKRPSPRPIADLKEYARELELRADEMERQISGKA